MKIILFNGPPRSGKDTAAALLDAILSRNRLPCYKYKFAQPLKDAVHSLFGMPDIMVEHFDAVKETQIKQFFGMSPREAYIWLSEKCAKPKFGNDFFARVAVNHLKQLGGVTIVISDCGFQAEVNAMVEHFGSENVALVHLLREGTSFEKCNDSRRYVDHAVNRSYVINNNGTLSDFSESIEKTLGDFINGK